MEPITLRQFLALLQLRLRAILSTALPLVIVAAVVISSRPTLYRATSKIFLSGAGRGNVTSPQALAAMNGEKLRTLQALLESYPLYQDVRRQVGEEFFGQRDGLLGQLQGLLALLQSAKDNNDADPENDGDYTFFRKHVVFKSDFTTENFEIGYETSDPDVSARVAENLVKSLSKLSASLEKERSSGYRDLVQRKLSEARKSSEQINQRIAQFIKTYGMVDRGDFNEVLRSSRSKQAENQRYQNNVIELEVKLTAAQDKLNELRKKQRRAPKADNSKIKQSITAEINRLETALASSGRYQAPGPEAEAVRRRIKDLYAQLENDSQDGNGLANEIERALASVAQLKTDLKVARTLVKQNEDSSKTSLNRAATDPKIQQQWNELLSERDANTKLMTSLNNDLMETSVGEDKAARLLTIQSKPTVEIQDAHTAMKLLIAAFAIFAAVALAFIAFDVQTGLLVVPGQLMSVADPLFMGVFPHLTRLSPFTFLERCARSQVVARLGFTLHRFVSATGSGGKLVAFCGHSRRSGVSTTAWGMAVALSDIGKSVLLIDCDFRRRKLINEVVPDDSEKFTQGGDLATLLQKGAPAAKRGGVLVTHLFEEKVALGEAVSWLESTLGPQMAKLKETFDYLLVDLGPVDNIDSLAMVVYSDAVVICCRNGKTRLEALLDTANLLTNYAPDRCQFLSVLTDGSATGTDTLKVGRGPESPAAKDAA